MDNDVSHDATLTATLVNQPANGTVTLNADGSFTYTPNAGFQGYDVFTYQDSDGTTTSNPASTSGRIMSSARICTRESDLLADCAAGLGMGVDDAGASSRGAREK